MSMTEAARQIRKLIELTASNLTDEQAATLPCCFPVWKEDMEVKEGERYAVRINTSVASMSLDEDSTAKESETLVLCKCTKSHITALKNSPEESEDYWEILGRGE